MNSAGPSGWTDAGTGTVTVTGDVCLGHATGTAGQYALIYAPSFSSSNERAVWVSNRWPRSIAITEPPASGRGLRGFPPHAPP
jgi:hypothetical protein